MPPPGIYLRDYNIVYWEGDFPLFSGNNNPGMNLFAYVNAPRIIWITDWKIFGADYGMDVIIPFRYTKISYVGVAGDQVGIPFRLREKRFGLGDIQVEPLLLSWHGKRYDVALGYAIWAPTGEFDRTRLGNPGLGFWSHMLTAGATWFPDEKKSWSASLLSRYEINHEREESDLTVGNMLTLEWGVAKTVHRGIDVGLLGYWQKQTTRTEAPFETTDDSLSHVVAIGPEVSAVWPNAGFMVSARYLREFSAKNHFEGDLVALTLTKWF